ncbi:hypothetical protein D3C72_2330310 [compost metagenome]
MTLKLVVPVASISESKRTPKPAPSARLAAPLTLNLNSSGLAASSVTIRLPSVPTFRLLTSTWLV